MIKYQQGDATAPQLGEGETGLLIHVCNNLGGWGRGFVLEVSRRWPEPEAAYRSWQRGGCNEQGEAFGLGQIQCVQVEPSLHVVNMIAQVGYRTVYNPSPLRFPALMTCLGKVAQLARSKQATIHMPRIGTGNGGCSWAAVEPVVSTQLSDLFVTVYDYGL